MKFTTTSTDRPKGARVHSAGERKALYEGFVAAVGEFMDSGAEWAELDGWEVAYANAETARVTMSHWARGTEAVVHRVGDSLYLRRRWSADE